MSMTTVSTYDEIVYLPCERKLQRVVVNMRRTVSCAGEYSYMRILKMFHGGVCLLQPEQRCPQSEKF